MFVVDLLLGSAMLAVIISNIRARKIVRQNIKLLTENAAISEHLIGENAIDIGETVRKGMFPHLWSISTKDTIYRSALSTDQVVLSISVCMKCRLIHRHIIKGYDVAERKGLLSAEGFVMNGIKVADIGCLVSNVSASGELE